MASKATATMAFLLSLNLLFFTMVTSANVACPPPSKTPKHTPQHSQPNLPTNKPATCPKDTLKLGVCANFLIQGLVDLEAAVCLCTAIKANVLGINLNVPLSLSLLLNYCGKNVPKGFQCA
ncbi:hypothetical protein ACJW31_11G108100 [Castanea mollissima]